MADISIRLNLKNSQHLTDTLRELAKRVEDMTPVNRSIADYMARAAKYRIARSKTSPDGDAWAKLSPITDRIRAGRLRDLIEKNEHRKGRFYLPGDILYETGDLYRSIQVGFVTAKSWQVKADAPYASYQQKGVPGHTPARPFLGFSETNKREMMRRMTAFINAAIKPQGE